MAVGAFKFGINIYKALHEIIAGGQIGEAFQRVPKGIAIDDSRFSRGEAFDIFPSADVVVLDDPFGGFYIGPSFDGSRPGAFYAGTSVDEPYYRMPSLTYHESVPGHHTQIAIAMDQDVPAFRKLVRFTGFVEGWALYAERLAQELGRPLHRLRLERVAGTGQPPVGHGALGIELEAPAEGALRLVPPEVVQQRVALVAHRVSVGLRCDLVGRVDRAAGAAGLGLAGAEADWSG